MATDRMCIIRMLGHGDTRIMGSQVSLAFGFAILTIALLGTGCATLHPRFNRIPEVRSQKTAELRRYGGIRGP